MAERGRSSAAPTSPASGRGDLKIMHCIVLLAFGIISLPPLARAASPYDAAFDDVVASLVLHYLEDWTEPLAELRRVLKPGGRLILSLNHPIVHTALNPDAKYFDIAEFSFDAEHAGRTVTYNIWHRPLQAMSDAFAAAGFRISVISEPPIAADTPVELRPQGMDHPARFISFIFFVLEAS